jgi:DUF4097 and DUF4098 domain-containing protein YvlB
MRLARYTVAAAALLGLTAAPALAQVDVRVKIDTRMVKETAEEIAREIRSTIRSSFGPEFRRDLHDAARDIAESFAEFGNLPWSDSSQSSRYRATQTDRETRRFNIGPNGQVDLETISGDVTVRRGSARELVVEIIREAHGTNDAAAKAGLAEVKAVSEERGGRVIVRTEYPGRRGRSEYSVNVSYIVTAPAGTKIDAESISGDISVDNIDGELTISCTSGDVKVTNATRLMKASTASGEITLLNVGAEGLLEASTLSGEIIATGVKARRVVLGAISGSITARGVDAGDVKLSSVSDDLMFEGPLTPRGRYEFSTHAGDVHLTLDGRTGFSFDGSTFSGTVRSDLALQNSRTETRGVGRRGTGNGNNRSLTGTFGDGSAVINASSFTGTIVVTRK